MNRVYSKAQRESLGHTTLQLFLEVRRQHAESQIGLIDSPLILHPHDVELICDEGATGALQQIASGPSLPWRIRNLQPALQKGMAWLANPSHARLNGSSLTVKGPFVQARMLVHHVLHAAQEACINGAGDEARAKFGLSEHEVIALSRTPAAALMEASAHVKLALVETVRVILQHYRLADSRNKIGVLEDKVLRLNARMAGFGCLTHS